MLQPVPVGSKGLADYTHLVGRPLTQEIRDLAQDLQGLRVLHLSATAFGGGVSEILYTLVPLMRDVGIDTEWQVMLGREEFYNATKLLHNALQGNPLDLTPEEWKIWEQYNEMNARELEGGWDVIIVHDPQPAAIRAHVPDRAALGVALPHRPLDAAPAHDPPAGAAARGTTTASVFHLEQLRPGGARLGRPHVHLPAGDRPALAEEHGACRRRTRHSSATSSASTWTAR